MLALALALAVAGASPTVDYVKKFRPGITDRRAAYVAKIIDRAATEYGQDPCLMAAIVRVESYFDSGLIACWPVVRNRSCTTTCDRGLAQINEVWIGIWKLNAQRLQFDDLYNLRVMARLLKQLRTQSDAPDWYMAYHSSIERHRIKYMSKLWPFLSQCPAATFNSGEFNDPERPHP
jgi:hypothetical protein